MRYVLSRKDTPLLLSAKYGIPLCMLMQENPQARWRAGEAVQIPLPCLCHCKAQPVPQVFHDVLHEVRQGETVYTIARQYETVMHQILARNGLARPQDVKPGMQLYIPCLNDGFMVYSYGMADTIALVAKKFAMTEQELLRINSVQSEVYPGIQLVVRKRENA